MAITLDRLLDQGASKYFPNKPIPNPKLERRNTAPILTENKLYLSQRSPALYVTPESTPLPDSPSSFSPSPSPYIVNHKRRGPRLLKRFSKDDIASCKQTLVGDEQVPSNSNYVERDVQDSIEDVPFNFVVPDHIAEEYLSDSESRVALNMNRHREFEYFFDPRESMSFSSNTSAEDFTGAELSVKQATPVGEYYDAFEELSNEGTPRRNIRDLEAELHETKFNLLAEIEGRKEAEEGLNNMRSQWERISQQLSLVGLTFPTDLATQVCVARFVAESVGRGSAKAEIEKDMESQIESKNFDIARLMDKLHYYESVNREMSQRNQEAVEMSRRERQRRKRRQRWVWGSIAAAITLGSAALIWSFLPTAECTSSSSTTTPDHAGT